MASNLVAAVAGTVLIAAITGCGLRDGQADTAIAEPSATVPPHETSNTWRLVGHVDRMTDVKSEVLSASGEAGLLHLTIGCPVLGQRDDVLLGITAYPTSGALSTSPGGTILVSTRFDQKPAALWRRWDASDLSARVPYAEAPAFLAEMASARTLLLTLHQRLGPDLEETFSLEGFPEAASAFLERCGPRCVGLKAPGDRDATCRQLQLLPLTPPGQARDALPPSIAD